MNLKHMKWLKIIGLSFAAFILAFFLPLLLFILSIAGIFYFSKKKPDKTLRNLSIALAVLSLLGVAMNDTNTPEPTEKEAEVAVIQESEEEKSAESESLEKAKQKELEEKESKEKEEVLIAQKEAEEKALEEKESKEAEQALIAQKESEEEETRQMLLETIENDMILSFIDTFNTDIPGMVIEQDESDPKVLYVRVVDENLSNEIAFAIVNEKNRESFSALLDSLASISQTVEETMGEGYTFMFLNPANEESTIAIVMSGVVVYNAFDELD